MGEGIVLIVDDEEIVSQYARHALLRYGYQCLLAQDGAEALEAYNIVRKGSAGAA